MQKRLVEIWQTKIYLVRKIQEIEDKIIIHLPAVLPYVFYNFYVTNFWDLILELYGTLLLTACDQGFFLGLICTNFSATE